MPFCIGWVENFDEITLSCTVKKIEANSCFSIFGKNLKIQNGRHFWFFFCFFFLFGVLRRFQHCTGHITTGSWKGRGNQYIEFARVVYCKLPTNGKQLPAFPLTAMTGIDPRPQRWEARVLPLCHRGPPPPFLGKGNFFENCQEYIS